MFGPHLTTQEIQDRSALDYIITEIINDGRIGTCITAMTSPVERDWWFESNLYRKLNVPQYSRKCNLRKIISFEEDEWTFEDRQKLKPISDFCMYSLNYDTGARFLQDQGLCDTNIVRLMFNEIPTFKHLQNIANIAKNVVAKKALIILTFNTSNDDSLNKSFLNEYSDECKKSQFRYIPWWRDVLKNIELNQLNGYTVNECLAGLVPKFLSKFTSRFDQSLFYLNYHEGNHPSLTMAFGIGFSSNYIKSLQLTSEAYFYKNDLEVVSDEFNPKFL